MCLNISLTKEDKYLYSENYKLLMKKKNHIINIYMQVFVWA